MRGSVRSGTAVALLLLSILPSPAQAQETVTYSYDALGRLKGTAVTGGVNNGLQTTTEFDKADNRTSYAVMGSPYNGPRSRVIVVPLNGFTIIPLP